jgi:hypothetical protein
MLESLLSSWPDGSDDSSESDDPSLSEASVDKVGGQRSEVSD